MHTIPGPAKNVVADCLWWPPIIPALDDLPTHSRIARLNGLSSADSEDNLPSPLEKQDEDGFSMVDDPTKDRVEEEIQEPAVTVMLFIPGAWLFIFEGGLAQLSLSLPVVLAIYHLSSHRVLRLCP